MVPTRSAGRRAYYLLFIAALHKFALAAHVVHDERDVQSVQITTSNIQDLTISSITSSSSVDLTSTTSPSADSPVSLSASTANGSSGTSTSPRIPPSNSSYASSGGARFSPLATSSGVANVTTSRVVNVTSSGPGPMTTLNASSVDTIPPTRSSFDFRNSTTVTSKSSTERISSTNAVSVTSAPGVTANTTAATNSTSSRTTAGADALTAVIASSRAVNGSTKVLPESQSTTLSATRDHATTSDRSTSTKTSTGPTSAPASTNAATEGPVITSPPPGSPGGIATDIPPSQSTHAPFIAITYDGETYVLPPSSSVELIQPDSATVTLFASSVVSGRATVSVPALATQSSFSNGGLSIQAGPLTPPTSGGGGSSGGSGFPSLIDALKGLGSQASSIVNNLDSLAKLGNQLASGSMTPTQFASAAESSLGSIGSDLSKFVRAMGGTFDNFGSEIFEMTPDGLRQIFPARQAGVQQLDLLNSLKKLVSTKGNAANLAKNYWVSGSGAAIALVAAGEAIRSFSKHDWSSEKIRTSSFSTTSSTTNSSIASTGTSTSSSSTSSITATAIPHMFVTKPNTSLTVFQTFIHALPDAGNGTQITFPLVNWQAYVTKIDPVTAKLNSLWPFIDFYTTINEYNSTEDETDPSLRGSQKRNPGSNSPRNLRSRPNSEKHLKVISAKNQRDIVGPLPDYLFDQSLGRGSTIYVLDSGFNPGHVEFSTANGRTVRSYVVSNEHTLRLEENQNLWAPEDITDYNGHGTAVASVAGGITLGVASNANLVLVKIKNAIKNPYKPEGDWHLKAVTEESVEAAFMWLINDVYSQRQAGYTGKVIINLSQGYRSSRQTPGLENVFRQVLQLCEDNDIVFVIPTGNLGQLGLSLDEFVPQKLGTHDNTMITVGSVYANGTLHEITTFDAGRGGSITTYAVGHLVKVAGLESNTATIFDNGTSFAAPAVAGLAAYFASLPSLDQEWRPRSVARSMKDYIRRYAYVRTTRTIPLGLSHGYVAPAPDSVVVAYNRAPDGLCFGNAPTKRGIHNSTLWNSVKRRDASGDVDVMVSGTLVATSFSQAYCSAAPSTSTSTTSASTTPPLPTLPSASYCTEVLNNGRQVLHTKTGESCTYNTASSTKSVSSATSLTSSATPNPTPSKKPYETQLTCGTRTDAGNADYWYEYRDFDGAELDFCTNMTMQKPVFDPKSRTMQQGFFKPTSGARSPVRVTAKTIESTEKGGCTTFDAGHDQAQTFRTCAENLHRIIDGCDTVQHDNLWKQGGVYANNCILWEIISDATKSTLR